MTLDQLPIQLILFTLLLWPISRVWLRFQDGGVKLGAFLFWTFVWLTGVFVIFFPGFISFIAEKFGIGRGSDFAIYLALILLFYLVFRTNVTIENLKHEISKLVREISLNQDQLKSTKKHSHRSMPKKQQ